MVTNSLSKKFSRKIENFKCSNCSLHVIGNGFTNHCPKCLYSAHVDINPGDRAADCGGQLLPIGRSLNSKKMTIIIHQCMRCGIIKRNKTAKQDDENLIIALPFQ